MAELGTLEEDALTRVKELCREDGEALAKHYEDRWDADRIIREHRAEDPEFDRYLKANPQDPYGNYFVHGWDDPDYEPGAWIWGHHS